jgi:hypothetical protein
MAEAESFKGMTPASAHLFGNIPFPQVTEVVITKAGVKENLDSTMRKEC